jgi:maleate isomerase
MDNEFLTAGRVDTATGTPVLHRSFTLGPAPVIPLGWRLRLGVMLPSVNTVAEPQLTVMLPPGVSLHFTRLKLTGSSEQELLGMTERVEEAAALLADAEPQCILFHCTAVTTMSPAIVQTLRDRITRASGLPPMITSEALVAAFRALGARRIVMITPYIHDVNVREAAFLQHHGVTVLREHGLGLPGGKEFATVEPSEWYRLAMAHRDPAADAYFLSCAQTRTAEVIEVLEHDLGRPVVTSNQAALWHCLRESGLHDCVPGFGRLLRQ